MSFGSRRCSQQPARNSLFDRYCCCCCCRRPIESRCSAAGHAATARPVPLPRIPAAAAAGAAAAAAVATTACCSAVARCCPPPPRAPHSGARYGASSVTPSRPYAPAAPQLPFGPRVGRTSHSVAARLTLSPLRRSNPLPHCAARVDFLVYSCVSVSIRLIGPSAESSLGPDDRRTIVEWPTGATKTTAKSSSVVSFSVA